MTNKPIKIIAIVAMDEARVIGFRGGLPWHVPEDMKRFSQLTSGHMVLMGRKTFDSLPQKYKPLPNRKNVVVSRTVKTVLGMPDVDVISDPTKYILACQNSEQKLSSDKLWVIGGEQIYRATQPLWDEVYLTSIKGKHDGDAFFPEFEDDFELKENEVHVNYSFQRYVKKI